jgi:hypothetical protein
VEASLAVGVMQQVLRCALLRRDVFAHSDEVSHVFMLTDLRRPVRICQLVSTITMPQPQPAARRPRRRRGPRGRSLAYRPPEDSPRSTGSLASLLQLLGNVHFKRVLEWGYPLGGGVVQ